MEYVETPFPLWSPVLQHQMIGQWRKRGGLKWHTVILQCNLWLCNSTVLTIEFGINLRAIHNTMISLLLTQLEVTSQCHGMYLHKPHHPQSPEGYQPSPGNPRNMKYLEL